MARKMQEELVKIQNEFETGGGGTQTGRSATISIAASDSLNKEGADFVCDGIDDQIEIQQAIDMLPILGGKVMLLDGNFNTSDTIHLYREIPTWFNLFLEGQGLHATTINLMHNSNCDIIDNEVLTMCSGWKGVANMMIRGNETHQTSGHGIHAWSSGGGGMFDMRFHNVFAEDIKQNGFEIIGAWGAYFTNCLGEHSGGMGLNLIGTECYIYGFHSSANKGHGIQLRGDQLHLLNSRISDIDVGLRLNGIINSTIADNYIGNFGVVGGDRCGMNIMTNSYRNNIHDNIIIGDGVNSLYGIYYEGTGPSPNNIHDNIINGCVSGSLVVGGEKLIFKNNIIDIGAADILYWGDITNNHIVINNNGYNPRGVITPSFDNTNYKISPSESGLSALPNTANQEYEVVITPCRIISIGGVDVDITIKDVDGNTIISPGAICDEELEIGWNINFGMFSIVPIVTTIFK